MKIAIAGTGQVSTYLVSALTASGHDLVVLTRKAPAGAPLPVPHRVTDYTVPSLTAALHDREALISTVVSYTDPSINTPTHLAMLSAVIASPTCTTFVPSEWTSDALTYPDQPMFMREHTATLHAALRDAKRDHGIRYTVVCNSWFMDYVVPEKNRGLRDIGPLWPMDFATREFTVYGSGEMQVSLVTVGDVARAVARLVDLVEQGKEEWEEYTFIEGERMTWNQLFEVVNGASGGGDNKWTKATKPLSETVDQLVKAEKEGDWEGVLLGQFELLSYSGASLLPWEKVESQRKKFFQGLKFRTVKEVLDAVEADGEVVV